LPASTSSRRGERQHSKRNQCDERRPRASGSVDGIEQAQAIRVVDDEQHDVTDGGGEREHAEPSVKANEKRRPERRRSHARRRGNDELEHEQRDCRKPERIGEIDGDRAVARTRSNEGVQERDKDDADVGAEPKTVLAGRDDVGRSAHRTGKGRRAPVESRAGMAHRVTLIPGDGTGPELTEATRRVLEATGVEFDWDVRQAGAEVMEQFGGNPLPDETLASIRESGVALKGPITTPVGTGFRSVNVGLRKELDLFAQVRPCKTYEGVRTRFDDVDLVIVRENTEDLYAGIEYEQGTAETEELLAWIESKGGRLRWRDAGISIKPLSVSGTRRIVQFAFDYARRNGRRKVTAVHKANIMKFTDGLYLRVASEVAEENTDIAFDERIVDNMCMQLVQRPEEYDVLVLPNLYGDIVSDLAAGMIGGLGMAPGANFGERVAVFEPTHGSAPKYAGLNKVNPMAQLLSGMLMLRHLGEDEAADRLETALADVIREAASVTYDMKPTRDDPTAVGTSEVADAIIERLGVRV
jgi:isocitrate dehydrogenase (NAD+)